MRLRQIFWRQLDPEAYERDGLSPINMTVVCVVVLSSFLAVVETEPEIEEMAPRLFAYIEQILTVLFAVEYLIRLWAEGENPRFTGVRGRVRYALTPAAIIDLAAFLPSLIAPGTSSPMLLRTFRLLRILRLARLGRFSLAMRHLIEAVTERREVRGSRLFGQVPGRNKLKAGSRLLVSPFPEISFISCCCRVL